ncbi:MAG: type II toxin-antitoxin system VapC family toxin [Bryobacteraceae bacterium]
MLVADTSIWVDHFRKGNTVLTALLGDGVVAMHPFIVGELACGNLKAREAILQEFQALPQVQTATNAEVLYLIESRRLWGRGLGWTDMHLLASTILSGFGLWTLDVRLQKAADELGVAGLL